MVAGSALVIKGRDFVVDAAPSLAKKSNVPTL